MLTSIRIQNFRSIRDAQVKLGQVNLFIGPNNSGKSNFLKGIELFSESIFTLPKRKEITLQHFSKIFTRGAKRSNPFAAIEFDVIFSDIQYGNYAKFKHIVQTPTSETKDASLVESLEISESDEAIYNGHEFSGEAAYKAGAVILKDFLSGSKVYRPDPGKFIHSESIESDDYLNSDCSNLVSFLFNLGQNHKKKFQQLETDLKTCVGNIDSLSTPAEPGSRGRIKLKFFDQNGYDFWAEEVSEGVLYFLALLCIIHQPHPPKILLLEEPEKGIHPRRIKEVMDFIFELARLRDIQIIITSHSPYVVDHFADMPECISVFDRENSETVIHNAADLIEKTNEEYAAQGLPPTSYKDSLGEYWLSGFLGGVPL
ncbi:MAG TPA: AAA family ATPase [Hymenobacter sp.]|uniref:AAA family ATPase n=1 Tax=Hymenobacter sp. TaxID=1898978 RepID=UPI002D7FC8C1|nr:AAA family ATPase [Hymenobacter sp.]HET9505933.1 AAA family ATPase [Hymenobacter sp.]